MILPDHDNFVAKNTIEADCQSASNYRNGRNMSSKMLRSVQACDFEQSFYLSIFDRARKVRRFFGFTDAPGGKGKWLR